MNPAGGGNAPIHLNAGRYFVVVGAMCEGRYAIFNTDTSELRPFNEQNRAPRRSACTRGI